MDLDYSNETLLNLHEFKSQTLIEQALGGNIGMVSYGEKHIKFHDLERIPKRKIGSSRISPILTNCIQL